MVDVRGNIHNQPIFWSITVDSHGEQALYLWIHDSARVGSLTLSTALRHEAAAADMSSLDSSLIVLLHAVIKIAWSLSIEEVPIYEVFLSNDLTFK